MVLPLDRFVVAPAACVERIHRHGCCLVVQAVGHDSEVILQPVCMVRDPFRGGDNILVLCECMLPDGSPHPTNTRHAAAKTFAKDLAAAPWYGMEQEYTMYPVDSSSPLGWPVGGYPRPQGPYYCGVGADKAYGRDVADAHYKACLYAGLKISGINAEVMPGQWEFQIGPAEGIEAGDHMVLARYLLDRVCEDFGVVVSLDPKPKTGDWNGSGCHFNYSTRAMREDGGMDVILSAIEKLSRKHEEHIAVYGSGNERRLTGHHETSSMSKFSFGVANRGASVRIPREAEAHGKGYFEDRRPASNVDPYVVSAKIFATTHLDE